MASNKTPTYKGAYCCVVGCHRETVRDKGKVNFFTFPTKNQEKRQLWIKAVNRANWEPKRHTRICSDHFVGERHREERDHPDYKPSIFPTTHIRPKSEVDLQRHERARKRNHRDVPGGPPAQIAKADEHVEIEVSFLVFNFIEMARLARVVVNGAAAREPRAQGQDPRDGLHAVWFIRNTEKLRLVPALLCVSYFLIVKLDKND